MRDAILSIPGDVRFALRQLFKSPAFTLPAILTLAFGIGVNTLFFTLLNALALRPLPVPDPSAVVRVYPVDEQGRRGNLFSYDDYVDYRAHASGVVDLAAYVPAEITVARRGGETRSGLAYLVSDNYLPLIGNDLTLGRTFSAVEASDPLAQPVAIVSHHFWQQRLESDPLVLDRSLTVNGREFSVVGVGRPEFTGTEPLAPDLWVPLGMQRHILPGPDLFHDRHAVWLLMMGRLAAGISVSEASASLAVVPPRLAAAFPGRARPAAVNVTPARFFALEAALVPLLAFGVALVGMVLLVACANVANLTLARGTARGREMAIRLALGAGRRRVVQTLLTESVVVALGGGALGLLFASWTLDLLYPLGVSLLNFHWATIVLDITPDLRVFGYTMVVSIATGVIFGLAPALQTTRRNMVADMQDAGLGSTRGIERRRLQNALVVLQVAVSLMLLVGAGLLVRSLERAEAVDLGMRTDGVVVTSFDPALHGLTAERAFELLRDVESALAAFPGVTGVAATSHVPLGGGVRGTRVQLADGGGQQDTWSVYTKVSREYFDVLGLPIVHGRNFTDAEVAGAAGVAVISDALARRFWPGQDPVGKRIRGDAFPSTLTVVGVVRDSANASIWRGKEISIYIPFNLTGAEMRAHLLARTDRDAAAIATAVRGVVQRLDSTVLVTVTPLEQELGMQLLPSRVAAVASAALGVMALLMAALGVYGVLAYLVGQRRREIGIRMALGADRAVVVTLVLYEGARLVGGGLAAGLAGAAATTWLLRAALVGVSVMDSVAFVLAAGFVIVVAAIACYIPATRAARVDPLSALRQN